VKLERSARPPIRRGDLNVWIMAGVLAALCLVLAVLPATGGVFLTQGNLSNVLAQSSVLLVISVGMTMVILIRGIDLSVGAGLALIGVVAALVHDAGMPAPVTIAAALATGAAIGAWHGFWVGWLGLPAFIVTLAGFKAFRGGALVLSHAHSMSTGESLAFVNTRLPVTATWAIVLATLAIGLAVVAREAIRRKALGLEPPTTATVAARMAGQIALAALALAVFGGSGIPCLVLVACAIALWGQFVTRRTRFGRHLYAIGGNPEAARLSGIDVRRTTLGAYVIVGVLTAVATLLFAGRVGSISPGLDGHLLELDAVTAVVIGGTSLNGGRGSVVGTVLGTLVFATLSNGMTLLHIDSNWQWIFTGLVLLVAVLISKGKRS
jgi:D-xylose transport system permease protein